jgi:hypothetical protein
MSLGSMRLNPPLHTQHNEGNPLAAIRWLGVYYIEGWISNTFISSQIFTFCFFFPTPVAVYMSWYQTLKPYVF